MRVKRFRVSWGDENVPKLIMGMVAQLCEYTKTPTELYTLNR